jgi:hypothetical protein
MGLLLWIYRCVRGVGVGVGVVLVLLLVLWL